jgi:hypothetical protein
MPQATQASCRIKAKCWARLRRSGLGFGGATQRGMRGVVIGFKPRRSCAGWLLTSISWR